MKEYEKELYYYMALFWKEIVQIVFLTHQCIGVPWEIVIWIQTIFDSNLVTKDLSKATPI